MFLKVLYTHDRPNETRRYPSGKQRNLRSVKVDSTWAEEGGGLRNPVLMIVFLKLTVRKITIDTSQFPKYVIGKAIFWFISTHWWSF